MNHATVLRALACGACALLSTACNLDSVLPVARGCQSDQDCVQGTCVDGTCGDGASSSSSGGSSGAVSSSSAPASSSMAGGSSGGGGGSSSASGPRVIIHVRSTQEAFSHADGLAGQTPQAHFYGIRALSLYRDAQDTAPVELFNHGTDYVEAELGDATDTVVGTVAAGTLPEETFTLGRVVLSHIRYRVDATLHSAATLAGTFENLHVLGDDVTYGGSTFQLGDVRYIFHSLAGDFTRNASNGALPTVTAAQGVRLVQESREVVLYLPAAITTSAGVTSDVDVSFVLNTDHCFRWQDEATQGYATDVFDATATGTEPVLHFGANSYQVTLP